MWGAAKLIPSLLAGSATSAWDLGSSAPSREVRDPGSPTWSSLPPGPCSGCLLKSKYGHLSSSWMVQPPVVLRQVGWGGEGIAPVRGPLFGLEALTQGAWNWERIHGSCFPSHGCSPFSGIFLPSPSYHLTGLRPQTPGAPHPRSPLSASERRSDDTSDPGPGHFLGKGIQRRSKASRQRLRAEG